MTTTSNNPTMKKPFLGLITYTMDMKIAVRKMSRNKRMAVNRFRMGTRTRRPKIRHKRIKNRCFECRTFSGIIKCNGIAYHSGWIFIFVTGLAFCFIARHPEYMTPRRRSIKSFIKGMRISTSAPYMQRASFVDRQSGPDIFSFLFAG